MAGFPRRFAAPFLRRALVLPLWLCFGMCFSGALASGDEIQAVWNGGSGNWSPAQVKDTNWTCTSVGPCVPNGSGYEANIGIVSGIQQLSGTVILNQPVSLDAVSLGNGASGGLDISSPVNSLTVNALNVGVVNGGASNLTVQSGGGATVASSVDIGVNSGSSGNVTVTGAGSQLSTSSPNYGSFLVGEFGQGTLTIRNDGVVNSADIRIGSESGSAGSVTISGPGSTLNSRLGIGVGIQGPGMLTIQNGGVVNGVGGSSVGISTGNGTVTVSDPGSRWNIAAGDLYVGQFGQGILTIQNGGVVDNNSKTFLGFENPAAGTVTVVGSGSQFNNAGDLRVGEEGVGTLTVTSGGQATNDNGAIGLQSSSKGVATVTGAGSQWINAGSLNIGMAGSGELDVNSGGLVSASAVTIGTNGTVEVSGGTLAASTITNHGVLSGAQVNLNGGFILAPDGTIIFNILGNGTGAYSVLDINGSSLFQGTLDFSFGSSFTPLKGDTFDLINDPEGANFMGAAFEITGLRPGFDYTTSFSNGMFVLTALNNGVNITPEPGTLGLMAAALAIGFCIHRRGRIGLRRQA